MPSKKRLKDAIANGKRNLEVIQRVHNWCVNAQVVCDARGMLAEQTGLPIGSHHMSA